MIAQLRQAIDEWRHERPGFPTMLEGRRQGRDWLRRAWWRFIVAALVFMALGLPAILLLPGAWQFILGFWLGVLFVALPALYQSQAPGRSWREGAEAERWTATALRRLRRRGWNLEHNIPFEGRDIDHVLVGPGGLIAVETKMRNARMRVTETGIVEVKANGRERPEPVMLSSARRKAWDLHMLALALPGRVRVTVVPLLVLWGSIEPIPGGAAWIDGVLVARGVDAKQWTKDLRTGVALSDDEVERVLVNLRRRQREHRHEPWMDQEVPPPDESDSTFSDSLH